MQHAQAPTTAEQSPVAALAVDLARLVVGPALVLAWHPLTFEVVDVAESNPWPQAGDGEVEVATVPALAMAPEVDDLIARPTPSVVVPSEASAALRELACRWGCSSLAVVPVAADGDHHGVALLGLRGQSAHPARLPSLLERAAASASFAALRLDRRRLLDALASQRRSDPATGLLTEQGLADEVGWRVEQGGHLVVARVVVPEMSAFAAAGGRVAANDARRQLGRRLVETVGGFAKVASGDGGERFLLVATPGCFPDPSSAERALARACQDAFRAPVTVGRLVLRLQPAVGVATGPSLEIAWQRAEVALAVASAKGPGETVHHDAGLTAEVATDLALATRLAAAIDAGEVVPWFQPQVDAQTGRVDAVEALARWSSDGAQVPPARFILAAERSGLVEALDLAVLRGACQAAARWPGPDPLRVAVNLSGRTLARPDLDVEILGALAAAGLPASRLEVEVTETVGDIGGAVGRRTLRRLRAEGVVVAIDDFGTGWSSLARLDELPIDRVKLDRSFVTGLPHRGLRLVEGVVAMAHRLGVEVLAEGVETPEQLDAVRAAGATAYQGWLVAPALEGEHLARLLEELGPNPLANELQAALATDGPARVECEVRR